MSGTEIEAIRAIGIVGAGQMGTGIAQVAALAGYAALLHDVKPQVVGQARARIATILESQVARGRLAPEARAAVLNRISGASDLAEFSGADFVVEAVVEDEDAKLDTFRRLDRVCRPEVILTTNTSSISVTKLAASTSRPEKVMGMHFMNPAPVMKLVELVRGLQTSEETFATVRALAERLGKVPVEATDYPGFVVNRLLLPMINEAAYILMEGKLRPEDIDSAMKLGANHPMGPLALADLVGLDICLAIMRVLHEKMGEDKYRPCPLLEKYVEAGWVGRKSRRGFYSY